MVRLHDAPDILEQNIDECQGLLGYVIATLSLINSSFVSYTTSATPKGRRLSGGRSAPYLTHRTVKINVPSTVRNVNRYLTQHIIEQHRRAHRVRGHWRKEHFRGGRAVKRSWVKDHVRGDASLGFISQEHVVTAEGREGMDGRDAE